MDGETRTNEPVREFFTRSEAMAAFVATRQSSAYPWGSVVDGSDRLVLAPPERNVLYVVMRDDDGTFCGMAIDDPLHALDPDLDPDADFVPEDRVFARSQPDVESAFKAFLAYCELDLEPSTPGLAR